MAKDVPAGLAMRVATDEIVMVRPDSELETTGQPGGGRRSAPTTRQIGLGTPATTTGSC